MFSIIIEIIYANYYVFYYLVLLSVSKETWLDC